MSGWFDIINLFWRSNYGRNFAREYDGRKLQVGEWYVALSRTEVAVE